jgi:hypothetical protein
MLKRLQTKTCVHSADTVPKRQTVRDFTFRFGAYTIPVIADFTETSPFFITLMPTFQSNPVNPQPIHRILRKHPGLFGIPFLILIVGASFGLQSFTQTRYDLHEQKVQQVCQLCVQHISIAGSLIVAIFPR